MCGLFALQGLGMGEISPKEFGELVAEMRLTREALASTKSELVDLSVRQRQLHDDIVDLRQKYNIGKAGLTGIIFGLGFAIFGVKEALQALWKTLT